MNKKRKTLMIAVAIAFVFSASGALFPLASVLANSDEQDSTNASGYSYSIVDTGQEYCYSDSTSIPCPEEGETFYGQDGQVLGNQARYQDNGDGTVTDLVTGLMWQQDPGEKMTYDQAVAGASSYELAGYDDWRCLPSRSFTR